MSLTSSAKCVSKWKTRKAIHASVLTGGGLEVAGGVVALGDEDVVVRAALERLVNRDRRAHELLLDFAEAIETGLDLEVVIRVSLGDGADNGDVVALGANVVCP
jgi:hypothetical protein